MTTNALLSPVARQREFSSLGVTLPGAKLFTFAADSSTPLQTYSDADLDVTHENTNPLIADSGGLFGPIYMLFGRSYDFVLKDTNDNVIWSQEHVTVGGVNQDTFNVVDYGAVGDGSVNDAPAIQLAIDAAIANGGGTVFFPTGIFRCVQALSALGADNVKFVGENRDTAIIRWTDAATTGLTIDTLTNAAQSSLLTVNPGIGDYDLTVADGSQFTVGEWAYLQDDNVLHGAFITKIASIVANVVTLTEALPITVLMADTAILRSYVVHPLLEGVEVRDLTFSCVAGSGTINKLTLLFLSRINNVRVINAAFDGAAAPLITTRALKNGLIGDCDFQNAVTVAGSGIEAQTSTGLIIRNCSSYRCRFGFVVARSPKSKIEGCNAGAFGSLGGRMMKVQAGANFTEIVGNTASDAGFTGVRVENAAYVNVTGNTWLAGSSLQTGAGMIEFAADPTLTHHCVASGNTIFGGVTPSGFLGAAGIVEAYDTAGTLTYNTIVGNNVTGCGSYGIYLSGKRATVVGNVVGCRLSNGAILYVIPLSGEHVIDGNVFITEGGAVNSPAIYSTGSAGSNLIGFNKYTAALNLDTSDKVAASTVWKVPTATQTAVHTGANTNETTAWTVTVTGGTLSVTLAQGFTLSAFLSTAANNNNKTIRVKVGTLVFTYALVGAAANELNIRITLEAFYNAGAVVVIFKAESMTTAGASGFLLIQSGTSSDNWANNQDIVITMQNGSASANDINFGQGKLAWEGVLLTPSPVS